MTLNRLWIPSPCYSSRSGANVRIIVLHTAEGARTIEDLGHFFQNYNNQVSSHTGADDKKGTIGEYVSRGNKAWTCANYNPVAVQIELCGFASWSTNEWKNNHHNMLWNCAQWIAEEAKKFGLPITKLSASQAQGSGRGVCQHRDLGAGGGGHSDCGNGFPMDYVLDMARGQMPPDQGPAVTYEKEDNPMWVFQWDAWNKCAVSIPKYFRDGKGDLFISGRGDKIGLEVIFVHQDGSWYGSKRTGSISTDDNYARFDIPEGCNVAMVSRKDGDSETNPKELLTGCFSHE